MSQVREGSWSSRLSGVKRSIFLYWKLVSDNELMALGGQVTYYLILSFFPLLLFFLTLASYTFIDSEAFFRGIQFLLPLETRLLVESIVYEMFSKRSPTLLSIGMLGTIWASLNGISALMKGVVKAYGLEERRNYIRHRLSALVLLMILHLTFFLSFYYNFLANQYLSFLETSNSPNWIQTLSGVLHFSVQTFFLLVVIIFIYKIASQSNYPLLALLPGSFTTAVGWLVLSWGFSFYLRNFSNFTITYGSIGGISLLLLWLYWSTEILLLGAAVNAFLRLRKKEKAT